ncbi:MAG: hypothetical protein E6K53_09330 [Gammaproteobacteria bacterium]|nr:MAG: hypothetical protein E6K53_09330 [Gammaproteobacteria bacterium]
MLVAFEQAVVSEGAVLDEIGRDAGAQEPECTVEYVRIPSTAGASCRAQQPLEGYAAMVEDNLC